MANRNRIGIIGKSVDLYVRFLDSTGNPVNTDSTPEVSIIDSEGTLQRASSNVGVGLVDDNTEGLYLLSYDISSSAPDGYMLDTWVAEIGNEEISNTFQFIAIHAGSIEEGVAPEFQPGDDVPWDFTKDEVYGINILLKMLKPRLKNDGTRKVRSGDTYIDEACSIFTDAELISFLVNSLSTFNQHPHFSTFEFSDSQIYGIYADIIIQGAMLLALASQALIERGREFAVNDAGITFQPPAVSEILNSQYGVQLADYNVKLKAIKHSLKPQPFALGTWRVTSVSPRYLSLRHLRARRIY